MVHNKLYLLLAILFVVIVCSVSADQKPRKDNSGLNQKKKVVDYKKNDAYDQDKDEQEDEDDIIDDNYTPQASYGHNRYLSSNPPEGNYRTRSRWPDSPPSPPAVALPSPYEEFMNGNDWSQFGYGNAFSARSPSVSFDSNPMFSNGPTCHSLIDPQYPIFSDTCGAVPQARYALPNAFGHRERWQISQLLNVLIGSSTDPACTRSLRLLLCPVLFPPCPSRHEPPPVLPCQSYCRAIKARCAIPTLDFFPCEVLPYSSDICPTNQPYGSFIPPGGFPSFNQPLPMNNGPPPSNYPPSRSFSSLESLLSSEGLQAALSAQGFQSPMPMQAFQSPMTMQNFQSSMPMQAFQPSMPTQSFQSPMQMQAFQSQFTPQNTQSASSSSGLTSGPTGSSFNLYNGGSFGTDSSTPMFADYPSRSYNNDYRQGSRYAPLTRSSSETRSSSDTRAANGARPSAVSSVVKA